MAISIEDLRPDDHEARHMLGREAFGHTQPFDGDDQMPGDRFVAVYDGTELIASSALVEGGHWFGGRPLEGAGITGVSVAAHRRGTGVARPMMEAVVHKLHDEGAAISGLLPTTAGYYRGAGWELAGDWQTRQMPVEVFDRTPRSDAEIEPFDLDDLEHMSAAYDDVARQSPGHVVRGSRWWWLRRRQHRQADAQGGPRGQAYLLRACVGDAEGYIILRSSASDRRILDLSIVDIGAEDHHVLRALGGQVARFGTVADIVKAQLPPWLLETLTPEGQRWLVSDSFGWMLRIVDIERAFAQRGWPAVDGRVVLRVDDPVLDVNTATFAIEFDNGRAHVERVDEPGAAVSIQALASWFTGWRSASQLAFLGRLQGADRETLALLDGLNAGTMPLTNEFY